MICGMGAPKGRQRRADGGEFKTLFAYVGTDVIDILDVGAKTANLTRAAYLERLVREMPLEENGLPPWLVEAITDGQLPPSTTGEEPGRAAA
jgi:hypothetical protein